MNTPFKSALDKVQAEEELVTKTEAYLRNTLYKSEQKSKRFDMRSGYNMRKIVLAACSLVLVCGFSVGAYAFYKTPVKYLSLDINPSVELGVNAANQVVSATPYNEDGKTIMDGEVVENQSVENAVKTLVQSAADHGFVAEDGSTIVSVTSETNNDQDAAKLEEDAEKGVNDALNQSDVTAVVYKDNVALARRDEARKLGITPGKLNLIQKLQALDPTITVDQYKDAKVTEIMKKVVELKKAAKTSDKKDKSNTDSSSNSSAVTSGNSTSSKATETQNVEKAVAKSEQNKVQKAAEKTKSNGNSANANKKSDTAAASSTVSTSTKASAAVTSSAAANSTKGKATASSAKSTVSKASGNTNNTTVSKTTGNGNGTGNAKNTSSSKASNSHKK